MSLVGAFWKRRNFIGACYTYTRYLSRYLEHYTDLIWRSSIRFLTMDHRIPEGNLMTESVRHTTCTVSCPNTYTNKFLLIANKELILNYNKFIVNKHYSDRINVKCCLTLRLRRTLVPTRAGNYRPFWIPVHLSVFEYLLVRTLTRDPISPRLCYLHDYKIISYLPTFFNYKTNKYRFYNLKSGFLVNPIPVYRYCMP